MQDKRKDFFWSSVEKLKVLNIKESFVSDLMKKNKEKKGTKKSHYLSKNSIISEFDNGNDNDIMYKWMLDTGSFYCSTVVLKNKLKIPITCI